ncbi:MAG: diguanylate cyclase [Mariprofundaceae bacterium]
MSIISRLMVMVTTLVLITAGSISVLSYQQSKDDASNRLNQLVKAEVEEKIVHLSAHVETLQKDVHFLARLPSIKEIIHARESGASEYVWSQRLGDIFESFLLAKPEYSQVRFIGIANKGREIVRVNSHKGALVVVPYNQLQQKVSRAYFQESMKLKPNQVYLSSINLNRENDQVEVPHKPVMRASTLVFDDAGKVFGMVIISWDMRAILSAISAEDFKGDHDYLLNSSGDILSGGAGQAFGFDLGKRHIIMEPFPEVYSLYKAESESSGELDLHSPGLHGYYQKYYFDSADSSRFVVLLDIHGTEHESDIIESNVRDQLVLYVVLMLIGILFAILLTRKLVRPFVNLSHVARKIEEGELEVEIPSHTGKEAVMLASAFESMTLKLAKKDREINSKIIALEKAHDDLEYLASTDALTGLYNRRFFNASLEKECKRAERYDSHLSLIMIDIDKFKLLNDKLGHQCGDDCLVYLANCMTQTIRDVDIAVRYGGEEFIIILPQADIKEAIVLAERLREQVEKTTAEAAGVFFTISSGVAAWQIGNDMTSESFIKIADKALYKAKDMGRNKVYSAS